jgi:hypothetical protein
MTVEFGYYYPLQKPIYGLIILGCIFLIKFSKAKTVELQSKRTFYRAGLIGIIFAAITIILPDNVSAIPFNYTARIFIYILYQDFFYAYNALFLVFFGVLFIITGFRNPEKKGKYLQLAGIFWLITYGLIMVIPFIEGYLSIFFLHLPVGSSFIVNNVLVLTPKIIGMIASIFLLLFGAINKQNFLIVAGAFFLCSFLYAFIIYLLDIIMPSLMLI